MPEVDARMLSTAMREGSAAQHRTAENSPFVTDLMTGLLPPEAYASLLLRLRRVYDALETAVRSHGDDPRIVAVHDPVLERVAAIDADLGYWAPGTDPAGVLSPATDAYVARLTTAAPGALVAHHYTRYLGDLSGGQAIARALTRTYGAAAAVTFFAFPIPKVKPYKDAYRARLDAVVLADGEQHDLVAEVQVAFDLNRALFTELGVDFPVDKASCGER